MYIPNAFMGSCFAGAKASSQAFLSLSWSVSAGVGGLRVVTVEFFEDLDLLEIWREEVKPGGSGKAFEAGFAGGVELRSRTH